MRSEDKPYGRACAQRLQIIRNARGLTQQQLAARLEKPQSYVCKVESCKLSMTVDIVVAFSDALGVDPGRLFSDALEIGRGLEVVAAKAGARNAR